MGNVLSKKIFTFTNDSQTLTDSLEHALAYIREQMTDYTKAQPFISRLRWIIIELLTNGVKHSGVPQIQLNIIFEDNELILEKMDNGRPLLIAEYEDRPKVKWPVGLNYKGKDIVVCGDPLHLLHARIDQQGDASFFVEAIDNDGPLALDCVSEHFGFIIIAKASGSFTYHYDEADKVNIFRCTFDLQKVA
ncbi:MAG: hypothetical protein H0X33_05290 [Taibaiella sp.]|nr:hypothetical protein [Taibaiella sp.]